MSHEFERENFPQEPFDFVQYANHIDKVITDKYRIAHPQEIARNDAILYGVSTLSSYLYSRFHTPPGEDSESHIRHMDSMIEMWQHVFDQLRSDDWEAMKLVIRSIARENFAVSAMADELLDDSTSFGVDSEQAATSFINLANSI